MDLTITCDVSTITAKQLGGGFFEGWPDPPDAETHVRLLRGSRAAAVAIDPQTGMVVGYVTAVGDGVLSAFIPLLEVLPERRGEGIGAALVRAVVAELGPTYMVDLACDDDVLPFYEGLDMGFTKANAMCRRDFALQSGRPRE